VTALLSMHFSDIKLCLILAVCYRSKTVFNVKKFKVRFLF